MEERTANCHACDSDETYVLRWAEYTIVIEYCYECEECGCIFTERDYIE